MLPAVIAVTMALAGTGMSSKSAYAQPIAPPAILPATPEQQPESSFTKKECLAFLSINSRVFDAAGQGKNKYNPELPETLARFIAPKNDKLVRNIIIAGILAKIAASKREEDKPIKKEIVSSATCNGSPYILVKGRGIDMFNTISDYALASEDYHMHLYGKGLRPITPEDYAALTRTKARPTGSQSDARSVTLPSQ